jgi:hypothetical protein
MVAISRENAHLKARLRNIAPPGWKTLACCIRFAPPYKYNTFSGDSIHNMILTDCVKSIEGKLFSMTISATLLTFITVASFIAPPLKVGMLAVIIHSTPLNQESMNNICYSLEFNELTPQGLYQRLNWRLQSFLLDHIQPEA